MGLNTKWLFASQKKSNVLKTNTSFKHYVYFLNCLHHTGSWNSLQHQPQSNFPTQRSIWPCMVSHYSTDPNSRSNTAPPTCMKRTIRHNANYFISSVCFLYLLWCPWFYFSCFQLSLLWILLGVASEDKEWKAVVWTGCKICLHIWFAASVDTMA